jgi:hypothetical protein
MSEMLHLRQEAAGMYGSQTHRLFGSKVAKYRAMEHYTPCFVSNTQFNKQKFKGELSRQEEYDREKEELLQDSFDLN